MKNQRPKNLNLFTIRMPLPAIVSILHRASGFFLFLFIPFLLWGLSLSLTSQQEFDNLHDFLSKPIMKFLVWSFLSALIYHLVAGVRHLIMDAAIGESLKFGRLSAVVTLAISAIFIILTGVWLW